MKQTGPIVVLVAYGMNELYCLVGLVGLGQPYHDPAVKIDILLDVPPPSSVSWVNSRMHSPEGEGMFFSETSGAIRTTTQRSSPEDLVPQHENRLVARKNCWLCNIYSVYCVMGPA